MGAIKNKPYVQSISVFALWPVRHPLIDMVDSSTGLKNWHGLSS
jgi:hypothetical protein